MFTYKNPSLQSFAEFIVTECGRCSNEDGNRFASALDCVFKKYRAVWILKDRANPVANAYRTSVRKIFEIPSGPMSQEALELYAHKKDLAIELELFFECFFLYSAILCDELAQLLLFLFGDARGVQLSGHRVLTKNFATYAANKKLVYAPEIIALAVYLEAEVCEFRDKQIVHDFHPRKTDFIGFDNLTGDIHLNCSGILYPKDSDSYVLSRGWNELISKLDCYVKLHLDLISTNFEKTRFNA